MTDSGSLWARRRWRWWCSTRRYRQRGPLGAASVAPLSRPFCHLPHPATHPSHNDAPPTHLFPPACACLLQCLKEEDRCLPFITGMLPILQSGIAVHHSGGWPSLVTHRPCLLPVASEGGEGRALCLRQEGPARPLTPAGPRGSQDTDMGPDGTLFISYFLFHIFLSFFVSFLQACCPS